jgi:glycosyltransferase involved in cell wall biosynthesis
MPVFNGEKHIQETLDSLLAQTFTDFELIISDNASLDRTEAICRKYAETDSRIRYIRQPENRGAAANFLYVLYESKGEYFMWAAADDVRSNDFLEVNYDFLNRNPGYVASTSPVRFSGGNFNPSLMGDKTLDKDSIEERVIAFFECWHKNGRYYSLFRRETLLLNKTLLQPGYYGSDWAVVLESVFLGKLNRSSRGEIVLKQDGISNSPDRFKICGKKFMSRVFPFWDLLRFTMKMSRGFSLQSIIKIFLRLLNLNLQASRIHLKYIYWAYRRMIWNTIRHFLGIGLIKKQC